MARYAREAELLKTLPGFGDVVVAGWLGDSSLFNHLCERVQVIPV